MDSKMRFLEELKTFDLSSEQFLSVQSFVNGPLETFREEISRLIKKDPGVGGLDPQILKDFEDANWNLVVKVEDVSKGLDKKAQRLLKEYFRSRAGEFFYSSVMLDKGFKKERGYPGDFEMMNYVYDNAPKSLTRMGQYFDRAFLDNGYACAVRGRKNKMVSVLRQEISAAGKPIRVLNLPCGPARDIKELLSMSVNASDPVEIVCVDQDEDALMFAKNSIPKQNGKVSVSFLKGDILGYIKSPEKYSVGLGKFDVVYSIGIADYLPDAIMEKMLKFSYGLLNDGGRLYFAYKIHDADGRSPLQPKWYCDWNFIPRSLLDAMRNFQAIGVLSENISVEWEESGRIAFLKTVK